MLSRAIYVVGRISQNSTCEANVLIVKLAKKILSKNGRQENPTAHGQKFPPLKPLIFAHSPDFTSLLLKVDINKKRRKIFPTLKESTPSKNQYHKDEISSFPQTRSLPSAIEVNASI